MMEGKSSFFSVVMNLLFLFTISNIALGHQNSHSIPYN